MDDKINKTTEEMSQILIYAKESCVGMVWYVKIKIMGVISLMKFYTNNAEMEYNVRIEIVHVCLVIQKTEHAG